MSLPELPIGPPPKPPERSERGKNGILERNPIDKVPEERTGQWRVRGRYGEKELVFISEILEELGYKRTTSNQYWDIIWTIRMLKHEFAILQPFQKVNFMPGMQFICSKNLLHSGICAARNRWKHQIMELGGDEKLLELAACNFWPVGFNLEDPVQYDILYNLFLDSDDLCYIIKKPFSSCGRGVSIIHSVDQLLAV